MVGAVRPPPMPYRDGRGMGPVVAGYPARPADVTVAR
ncbi:hypothetical protein DFJ67_2691 [Asanoa ferruginea]|jgi:hypothetical protein|uniref:Uncharacterized protein n=1 Tax=Asanoa ferruginea TaxID=53367 RepID=A0A3D9ZSR0_9ACTN|nr:hypothetical protein DFJ67_2691 [Asanoa ferruginea]